MFPNKNKLCCCCCQFRVCLLSDGTFARPNGAITMPTPTNSLRACCHLIHLMWTGHTRTSVMPSAQQPKSISHVVDETTTFRVGMLSVRTSIRCSCNRLRDLTLAELLLPCCSGLTKNAGTDGLRQSKPSTFLTPVVKRGAQ